MCLDDILVFSKTSPDHWQHLDQILGRLANQNLIFKRKKCQFAREKVEFLGYVIEYNGIKSVQAKCEAIERFSTPDNDMAAQRFLGMILLSKIHSSLFQIGKANYRIIMKKSAWKKPQQAFEKLKQ